MVYWYQFFNICQRVLPQLQLRGDKRGALCRANYPLAGSTPATSGSLLKKIKTLFDTT